jgi:hypothetical protein
MDPGHGLVLTEGDCRALAAAYVRYLAAGYEQFLVAGPELPRALHSTWTVVAGLARRAFEQDPRGILSCFASPAVGTPFRCLKLRADLEDFRTRIDDEGSAMLPHLLLEMAMRALLPEEEQVDWEFSAPRPRPAAS